MAENNIIESLKDELKEITTVLYETIALTTGFHFQLFVRNGCAEKDIFTVLGKCSNVCDVDISFVGTLLKPYETLHVFILSNLIIKAITKKLETNDEYSLFVDIIEIEGDNMLDPAKNILLDAAREMVAEQIRNNFENTVVFSKELFDYFERVDISASLQTTAIDTMNDIELSIFS